MLEITQVATETHRREVRELFGEYLASLNPLFERDFGISFDMDPILDRDMEQLHKFMPPHGQLLLAYTDGQLAGCACLRTIGDEVGEVKRMYVRPQQRRQGIGHALVAAIIAESRQMGGTCLRLDSAPFLPESHRLYRSFGFHAIPPYAGCEIPESFHTQWQFMELSLDMDTGSG